MSAGSFAFGSYSKYYDLLYRDKDYSSEIAFLISIFKRLNHPLDSILELGCGTGLHASLLAKEGYCVHGLDLSATMLEGAVARQKALPREIASRLEFSEGDVRHFDLNRTFDAVVSLFHVASYQNSNDDLLAMFSKVAKHLTVGGLFVFDYWYAPTVLTDRPTLRVKRMSSPETSVTRIAEPTMHAAESCVDVNYDIAVENRAEGTTERLQETHRMRYLSTVEVDLLARLTGFRVVESKEWLSGRPPGFDTWGVYSVLQKI